MKDEDIKRIALAISRMLKNDFDELLTAGQAAKMLGITPRTLYGKVKLGYFPSRKIFGKLYFSKKEITNYILNN